MKPGQVEYKTIDTRSLRGLRLAEAMKRNGWTIGSCGWTTIQFYRAKRSR